MCCLLNLAKEIITAKLFDPKSKQHDDCRNLNRIMHIVAPESENMLVALILSA